MNLSPADHVALLARDITTRVLAFDLGNQTGFAIHYGDSRPDASGSWSIWHSKASRPTSALEGFAALVNRKIDEVQPQVICYEHISAGGGRNTSYQSNKSLQELELTLKQVAEKRDVPLKGFYIGTIKAFAKHGKSTKAEMMAAAKRHYGVDICDENEADAFWIAKLFYRPDIWHEGELKREAEKDAKRKRKKKPKSKERRLF